MGKIKKLELVKKVIYLQKSLEKLRKYKKRYFIYMKNRLIILKNRDNKIFIYTLNIRS